MIFLHVNEAGAIQYPITESQVRSTFGDVSLPSDLNNCSYLTDRSYFIVKDTALPTYNKYTERCIEGNPISGSMGRERSWSIVTMTTEEAISVALNEIENTRLFLVGVLVEHMDAVARSLAYSNRDTICTYINSAVPKFHNEATAFISWRDQLWATALHIQTDMLSGQRSPPTKEGLIAELPAFTYGL
jgi:hypothetical protein